MAYIPPSGVSANFQIGIDVFPRPYNGLNFRQTLGGYSPPGGGVVLAQFPTGAADWSPPFGDSVDFTAWGTPAKIRLGTRATGRWVASRSTSRQIDSPYRAPARTDGSRRAIWNPAAGKDISRLAAWHRIDTADSGRGSSWGYFGYLMAMDRSSPWVCADRKDFDVGSEWDSYGDMLNSGSVANWYGSRPADIVKRGAWTGHLIPYFRIDPYIPPIGTSANFSVAGGGVDSAIIGDGGYSAPAGGLVNFQFGNDAYRVPFMPVNPAQYVLPFGSATKFICRSEYSLVLDGSGNPALEKSARDAGKLNPWGTGKRRDDTTVIIWLKFSRPMNPGWGIVTPGTPQPPAEGETVIIPVRRAYIVINEIMLVRVVGSVPIAAENLNVSFDCDSWLPTFSATIPESARDAVMPDPSQVEVSVYINGSEFHFFVEKVVRNRSFGKQTVSISGRGIACELDSPYAVASQHTNVSDMTAQQIIDAALGFSTYTQTWSISDWLVPAGALSLHGTPAAVAGHVAEAAGAVLSSDWASRDLRLRSRYPVKPWDFATATPEYVIPAALCRTESVEWLEKPSYNVVYVSGVQQGVLGRVKITGTAGDKPAAMVTHPLLTHPDPVRERGLSILGDTGRKAIMQISTPVLESTGVIDICRFIEFSDGTNTRHGIVRANNVSVDWPTVRQTMTIEANV